MLLAVGAPPLVTQLAVVIMGAALIGYVCQRIGLIPIVGYLAVGVVTGPNALGLVDDTDLVDQAAEIGVIFLLFSIGLELSGDQLRRMGSLLLVGGSVQVGLTILVVTAIGLPFDVPVKVGIYTGCLVALSSTAIVLKMLSDRGETGSPTGQVGVAFLIFQDVAVVIMVLLVPMLGADGGDGGELVEAVLKSFVLIAGVVVATRFVVPPLLEAVSARTNNEEFMLAVLAIAIGVGYLVTLLDLSASLGAFVGGLVVSSGPHRERATRFVMPFQVLFSAIFFASIGMLLDPEFLLDELPRVLVFAGFIVVIKTITSGVAAKALGRPWPVVASSALLLAQLGEFSFVLEKAGREVGLSPFDRGEDGAQTFIATSVLLFALTPLLFAVGQRLKERLEVRFPPAGGAAEIDSVVLVGAPEQTSALAQVMADEFPEIPVHLADAGAIKPRALPQKVERPPVQLLVIDATFVPPPDHALQTALRCEPPIPVVYRAATAFDVDHLVDVHGVVTVVDEVAAENAMSDAIRAALTEDDAHHGP